MGVMGGGWVLVMGEIEGEKGGEERWREKKGWRTG